jgi:hypothetical protein
MLERTKRFRQADFALAHRRERCYRRNIPRSGRVAGGWGPRRVQAGDARWRIAHPRRQQAHLPCATIPPPVRLRAGCNRFAGLDGRPARRRFGGRRSIRPPAPHSVGGRCIGALEDPRQRSLRQPPRFVPFSSSRDAFRGERRSSHRLEGTVTQGSGPESSTLIPQCCPRFPLVSGGFPHDGGETM